MALQCQAVALSPSQAREASRAESLCLAGVSNVSSACVTNPIDVVKIRMQMSAVGSATKPATVLETISTIHANHGARGFYRGLTASMMREGSYSTIRLGMYEPTKRMLGADDPAHTPLHLKIMAGATTGCVGSAIAVPTDLVKVRMQACTAAEPRYPSAIAGFRHIHAAEGGLRALYRGLGPTVQRGALLTATQIPSYDHSKHTILNAGLLKEGGLLHFSCSMFAGFCTAVVTSPIDVIKTRMMTDSQIRSVPSALKSIVATEGARGLYKGFIPNFLRIGPHTMCTLMIFEQLREIAGVRPV